MIPLLLASLAHAEDLPSCATLGDDPVLVRRCARALAEADAHGGDVADLLRVALGGSPRPGEVGFEPVARLEVVTWNVGLLWFLGGYSVPEAERRREAVARTLADQLRRPDGPDVVLLQEIYRDEDQALVREAVDGFATVLDARAAPDDWTGLLLVVRTDRLAAEPTPAFLPLQGDAFERAGFPRGVLWADLALTEGATVRVGNVHLSPMTRADLSWRRTQQALELVDALVDPAAGWACDGCSRVLGGDFNLAPDWRWDPAAERLPEARQRRLERWLRWDGVLFDLLTAASDDATPPAAGDSLVATNPLWEDYRWARGEPSRRVDHVFVRRGVLADSAVTLDAPAAGAPALSDHYGVRAEILLPADR